MKRIMITSGLTILLGLAAISACQVRTPGNTSPAVQPTPVDTQSIELATATPPKEAPSSTSTDDPSANPSAPGLTGVIDYQINSDETQARFSLDEILRGNPNSVVGSTNAVSGEIRLDFDQRQVQVGTIQVDASTLKTDSGMRDRMVYNFILETEQYQQVTFEPKQITGLPDHADFGQQVSFQITGNLTIRNVTKEVTFDVTATLSSKDHLEGQAKATILRSDFNLTIPSVPSVADVSDEVLLEIDFVAVPM